MSFGNFNQKRFHKPIPIKEGEEYEVTIENIGEKGDGIAKIEGYVIIIPDAKKGEKVKIKVNAIRGKVSFGEVVERLGEDSVKEDSKQDSGEQEDSKQGTGEQEEAGKGTGEENSMEEEPKEEESQEEITGEKLKEAPEKTDDEDSTEEESSGDSVEEEPKEDSFEEKKE